MFFLKDEIFESSSSRGKQPGKRPASSSLALGKKQAAEEDEEFCSFILVKVKSQVIYYLVQTNGYDILVDIVANSNNKACSNENV